MASDRFTSTLRVGYVLDLTVKLYRENFATGLIATFVTLWPLYALDFVISAFVSSGVRLGGSPSVAQFRTEFEMGVVAVLLNVAEWSIASAMTYRAFSAAYVGESCDWRTSLKWGSRRLGSAVALALVVDALLAAWAVLLIGAASGAAGPGGSVLAALVWLATAAVAAVSWVAAVPAMMAQGHGIRASLATSVRLVRGNRGAIVGALSASMLIILVLRLGIALVVGLVGGALIGSSAMAFELLKGTASAVAAVLLTPAVASLMAVVYLNLAGPGSEMQSDGRSAPEVS